MNYIFLRFVSFLLCCLAGTTVAWTTIGSSGSSIVTSDHTNDDSTLRMPEKMVSRRHVLTMTAGLFVLQAPALPAHAVADQPEGVDVDEFLRTGRYGMPMGLSGQSGKSRPETGVVLREGTDVARNVRTGTVAAELLLKPTDDKNVVPVLVSFDSPWPLATGSVFDVECRDNKSGESVFVAVTPILPGGSSSTVTALADDYIVQQLMQPAGRFSLYGQPTDVKVKDSRIVQDNGGGSAYKEIDLSFATLSQATQTELPRRARVRVTIPTGTHQAVLLVTSAAATQWKSHTLPLANAVLESFVAVPAPTTGLKVRAKQRSSTI